MGASDLWLLLLTFDGLALVVERLYTSVPYCRRKSEGKKGEGDGRMPEEVVVGEQRVFFSTITYSLLPQPRTPPTPFLPPSLAQSIPLLTLLLFLLLWALPLPLPLTCLLPLPLFMLPLLLCLLPQRDSTIP